MTQEIRNYILSKKLSGKSALVRYSSRKKICKKCEDRLKCVTYIQKSCSIRKKVDNELKKAQKMFKDLSG